jgi:hypothetical protein
MQVMGKAVKGSFLQPYSTCGSIRVKVRRFNLRGCLCALCSSRPSPTSVFRMSRKTQENSAQKLVFPESRLSMTIALTHVE